MATDPVCGMQVDEASAEWRSDHEGTTYYFCSQGCMNSFQADPEKYLGDGSTSGEDTAHHHHEM